MQEKILKDLIKKSPQTAEEFLGWKRKISKEYKINLLQNSELIEIYKRMVKRGKVKVNKKLESLMKKRAIRTSSGVSVITVLTKPYKCPGNCIYCPSEPKMPKSYLSNEPAAQRAARLKFDPIKQVQMRIQALEANGHKVDKTELLVLGGSFTAYTEKYKKDFITKCFYAANIYGKKRKIKSLEEEQKINEKSKYKIIGLTLETRPDEINEKVIKDFRELGCTRVQIGVQHIDNKILELTKRGHAVEESIQATRLLKENGFKVDHHYMPDLPGSTPAKDFKMMEKVFKDQNFKPDQIKIYPCVVNEYAEISKWFKKKKYTPYSEKQLFNLLLKIKKITPYWVRINRLIRDIPEDSIIAGNKITNLRQYLNKEIQGKCKCIRCREVGNREIGKMKLYITKYKASQGTEYFISYESSKRDIIYGFLRLRFNNKKTKIIFPILKDSALIRELHVYGQMLPTGDKLKIKVQHKGLGKKLMKQAEKISKQNGYTKISVISGIGVREYYKKLGYKLNSTYLTKNI
jgi:ELP3 family radical SAM enzyme/protein acetyltransferase